ncbi:MAG: SRPBCC domain-containing protein [Actinomycetota bacterium]|nr:SRPBCC domain-containing protein [Actinomycetota bacterium]
MEQRPVGLTRDAGWQIGVSRTVAADLGAVWDLLVSAEGLALWLGEGVDVPLVTGQQYETAAGTVGEVRSLRPYDRVRITWQPADRPQPATVQIAVRQAANGCSVRFHTERLDSSDEREVMRVHWKRVAAELADIVAGR